MLSNFVSVITAATTAFVGSVSNIPMKEPTPIVQNYVQSSVDKASQEAEVTTMTAGIVVIDRAKNNSTKTNGALAHERFPLQSLGRLPILLYAVLKDDEVAQGNVEDIVTMMQGSSANSTDNMWNKYGGRSIITELSSRYDLQETTAGTTWSDTSMSALDIARLYRRFLDDKDISTEEKIWTISMLRGTSLTVSGQDFSWGLPSAASAGDKEKGTADSQAQSIAWVQGWSASGQDPMVRSSTAILDGGMRYIAVIHGNFQPTTPDDKANSSITSVAHALVNGLVAEAKDEKDIDVENFYTKQKKEYKDFIPDDIGSSSGSSADLEKIKL